MSESRRVNLRISDDFQSNLDSIEAFLVNRPKRFHQLISQLLDEAIPLLRRFPVAGRDYFSRSTASLEAEQAMDAVRLFAGQMDASLREYIVGDFLMLYGLTEDELCLLAIRHHSQMGYDIREF